MKPKEFIEHVLIHELRDIVFRHPYLSFALISIGIEFLGKCMLTENKFQKWNNINPDKAYKKGTELMLEIDTAYSSVDLKELRNGFAHTLLPKKVLLSELKHGAIHFEKRTDGKTILVAEILYRDFVIACQKVLNTTFDINDKMNKEILHVG